MDASDSDGLASIQHFPVFAPSAAVRERVVRQRPGFAQTHPRLDLYTPVTLKKLQADSFWDVNQRIRGFLIVGAYFRPREDLNDPSSAFRTPKNPHPKMIKTSHFKSEVLQTARQRRAQRTSSTPFQIGSA